MKRKNSRRLLLLVLWVMLVGIALHRAHRAHGSKPAVVLVSQERFKIAECAEDDPLAPCEGERMVMENRSMTPQTVTINCGSDNDEADTLIPARTRMSVEIEMTIPSPFPACRIAKIVPTK